MTKQDQLWETAKASTLPLGKLAEMLIGPSGLRQLIEENIDASDDELCEERIDEIKGEEGRAKKPAEKTIEPEGDRRPLLQVYIDDEIKNTWADWDIYWDESPSAPQVTEDDGALFYKSGNVRISYYYGQDRDIRKAEKIDFKIRAKTIQENVLDEFKAWAKC